MIRLYSSTISYHVMITRLNFASFASSSFTQVVLKTSSKAVKIKQAKKPTASIYQPSNINLENQRWSVKRQHFIYLPSGCR